jgi:predicted metal-dependent peptidase
MKIDINELRKVSVKFEPEPPPPPPPPGTPPSPPPPKIEDFPVPPSPDKPWDDEDGGDAGGAGNQAGEKPRVIDVDPENIDELKEKWRREVEKARRSGGLPPELQKSLDKFNAGKVDWKGDLKRFVTGLSAKREYFLPNKRFLSRGQVLWGTKRVKEGFDVLTLIVDTSGSISQKELEVFINEAYAIVEEFNPRKTYVLFFDTKVYEPVTEVERGENIKVNKAYGGGGTSFLEPFQWIEKNLLGQVNMGPVVFFTDGYPTSGGWPSSNDYGISTYDKKVMWIIIHQDYPNNDPNVVVPFGNRTDLVY